MKKYAILTFVFLQFEIHAIAQHQSNIGSYFVGNWGYLKPLMMYSFQDNDLLFNELYASRYRFSGGFFINEKFAVGGGFGIDDYKDSEHNTFTLFVEGRWFRKPVGNSAFMLANIGRSIKFSQHLKSGFRGEWALGVKLSEPSIRGISLMPSIGINLQHMANTTYKHGRAGANQPNPKTDNVIRSAISFNFDIFF